VAEPGVIDAYLAELRYSVAKLPDADDIVDEAADHLATAVGLLLAAGVPKAEAEAQALGRFGSAQLVSKVFAEEAKRGAAVSTSLTRRAGLAAMVSVPLIVIGQAGNDPAGRGAVHGLFLGLLTAGIAALVVGLWGLRRRHGGLGTIGRVAFWWFVASPFLAAPFAYGAAFALGVQWLAIMVLLGVGMIRARVLPIPAVVLFALSPLVAIVISLATPALVDSGRWWPVLLSPALVGFVWLGWAMWREPALDVRAERQGVGPVAAM
jgi:hypothetical protein